MGLLQSLKLLEDDGSGTFITAGDGKRYPLPDFDEILERMQTAEMQMKLGLGFDSLLLVPFGLPLERFLEAWRQELRRNEATLRTVGNFNEAEPLWVYGGHSRLPQALYAPVDLVRQRNRHGARSKAVIVAQDKRGWDVLLAEGALLNLPPRGQERNIGERAQSTCGLTPRQYLRTLPPSEVGLTPESYMILFVDALVRRGRVLDTASRTYLLGQYLPETGCIPAAGWRDHFGFESLFRVGPNEIHQFLVS